MDEKMAAAKVSMGQRWEKEFNKSLELDTWGQIEEAREAYEKLATVMTNEQQSVPDGEWTSKENKAVERLALCLRLRSLVLKRGDGTGIDLDNMKSLASVWANLFRKDKKFPLDLDSVPAADLKAARGNTVDSDDDEVELVEDKPKKRATQPAAARGESSDEADEASAPVRAQPPRKAELTKAPSKAGAKKQTQVLVTVDKIGLKDYSVYVDPLIAVSIVSGGKTVDGTQETNVSNRREAQHIFFGDVVALKQPFEAILPGAAVFFEFKHFKAAKEKLSTKCWAFLEREDLHEGNHVLELYKKPTDFKRKKLSLLTVKQLYLSINVKFELV